jgi:phosphoribosylaminoimidazole-succinocarboxamide synthase
MPRLGLEPLPEPFRDITLPLGDRRAGKVRISYALDDDRRLFVTTDRLSAFDRIVAHVPYKGQVLNQLAAWWFDRLADLTDHHLLAVPDPNAMLAVAATPLPVEVVVRGALTGSTSTSVWRRYHEGARNIDGHHFPDGLTKNSLLDQPIITPTTKASTGDHDEPLSGAEVMQRGLVSPDLWDEVQNVALSLFHRGQRVAAEAGLILADTKYEFGSTADGRLMLIDEVHTPDSSRYWVADSLERRLADGEEPESLDKEPVRLALGALGYTGHGEPPTLPADVIIETTRRYVQAYERLTGLIFEPASQPVEHRLIANLRREGLLT